MEKTIGILGGMGPEATADLYMRIIRAVPVKRDQDHPRVLIYSDSKVPDRTAAILGKGPSPLPELVSAGRILQGAGADFIIMPCNTAHYFHAELQRELRVPVLHMIRLAAERVKQRHPDVKAVGLLATDGTLSSRLYEQAFNAQGVDVLAPTAERQRMVMDAIYAHIKRGDLPPGGRLLREASAELIQRGSQAVICGCTEVGLVLKDGDLPAPVLDSLQVLAEEAVEAAFGRRSLPV